MTDQDRFEGLLKDVARDYNVPPETPREEMWDRILAERQEWQRRQGRVWIRRHGAWVRWGVGIAAALVIGIGIGRFSEREVPAVSAASTGEEGVAGSVAYQFVAAQHFGHVEACLTEFQVEARQGRPVQPAAGFARDLLATTRLLLDSPAADEPQLRVLLEDIELVLAQIAQFAGEGISPPRAEEFEFIDHGIEQRSVLLRLRTSRPAQPTPSVAQGVL